MHMTPWGRRRLRERFDDAEHPTPQQPPETHRCDLYVATDAAMWQDAAGFGALVEDSEGNILGRWRRPGAAVDNNDAEMRALHFGLDRLAGLPEAPSIVGILLDHDVLAEGVAACANSETQTPVRPPSSTGSPHHWGGITARIAAIPTVRVALVSGQANPAHPIANGVSAD